MLSDTAPLGQTVKLKTLLRFYLFVTTLSFLSVFSHSLQASPPQSLHRKVH
ncbi:hypothetical protein YC2023_043267 [Brassica napus]